MFAFSKFSLYKHFNIIKDWRKKFQIKLSTIIEIFFFIPIFRLHSFLQADQLFRNKKYKNLFKVKERKHKTLLSDSHMFNCLLNIDSDQIREVVYKVFAKTDKKLYKYRGLTIGSIDGSTFGKQFASVFQMVSEKAPFVIDLEGYEKRGKELEASRKLVSRLVKRFGKGFVDLILVDGLYKLEMMKYFKNRGINILIKTREERLEVIEELESFLGNKLGEDCIYVSRGLDRERYERYKIYGMEYEWGKEKIKVAKVIEEKLKPRKGEKAESSFYVITNQTNLTLIEMRQLAKMRWNIENNGFKQLSSYGKTKHKYSKEWKVVENLMLIIFLSYNLMRLFKCEVERDEKYLENKYRKMRMTFICFVRMVGMLPEKMGGLTPI